MKKRSNLIILVLFVLGSFISCSDDLDTNPTNQQGGNIMLEKPEGGQAVMNGIYRAMYSSGWGSEWLSENSGIMAYVMTADIMGEDHVVREQGQGWFYYDYWLQVASDYTSSAGRSYQTWNFFYTIVNNANEIIGKENVWEEDVLKDAVLGQAYAIRAFAYYFLSQFFQQAYAEGSNLPGVPLYMKPTTKETKGEPRGTLENVYSQMENDIDDAIEYLKSAEDAGWGREHPSNIDYYVANGIKARIALAHGVNYQRVLDGAMEALSKDRLAVIPIGDFAGWNKKDVANVLWALEVISTQSEHYNGFFSHMDADAEGLYASVSRKLISTGLYNLIPDTDERKSAWWREPMAEQDEEKGNSKVSYCQTKFRFASTANRIGDYLIMRAEEMVLAAAEAECRLGHFDNARELMKTLGNKRDANYEARLAAMTNNASYGNDTNTAPTTLMEEILFQRRVELWGEHPRSFDLKRLRLGYTTRYAESNHSVTKEVGVADKRLVLPIPLAEFDGNENMVFPNDQNPM